MIYACFGNKGTCWFCYLCLVAYDVRLVGGDNNGTGRAEVLFNGAWATIYRSYFTANDARVFCRMMGFGNR